MKQIWIFDDDEEKLQKLAEAFDAPLECILNDILSDIDEEDFIASHD